MEKQWKVKEGDYSQVPSLCERLGILPLTARLLCLRGQSDLSTAEQFINCNPSCKYDPFLLKDMDKAVDRVKRAIAAKERVCIYGDYDVDGVTATTILYRYLVEKGVPCSYFIPSRLEDGYGLNKRTIEELKDDAQLIITVDTGITAVEETEYARSLGIDMVITDHHSCRDVLPDACAVVDPHRPDCEYPFKQLAGVGVVYKLLSALEGDDEVIIDKYGDIIAIGTIADVMPIVEENRFVTSRGIKKLQKTDNLGLRALMEKCNMPIGDSKRINSISVGFVLAPRINAAGRIKNAKTAVELLLADDIAKAESLADELCAINKERQATEQKIFEEVQGQIDSCRDSGVFVLNSDGWHQGVIGVVASRITERYGLPSVLFSFDGDIGKGSGRSIKGFSMLEGLKACHDLLEEYGGHELAAGLTIHRKNLQEFKDRLNAYANEKVKSARECNVIEADAEVLGKELTLKQAYEFAKLEPFGLQNPVPLLLLKDAMIVDIVPLAAGKHIRLRLECEGCRTSLEAVYFGMKHSEFQFRVGDNCDVLFNLEVNEFRGVNSAKLYVKKMRSSSEDEVKRQIQDKYYSAAVDADNFDDLPKNAVPTLNQFRSLFRLLKREVGDKHRKFSLGYIQRQLKENESKEEYSLCALRLIFDVLNECKLAECSICADGSAVEIKLLPFAGKVNLDCSPLLIQIKNNHKLY